MLNEMRTFNENELAQYNGKNGTPAHIIISGIDHWIAFGLLSLIGCKTIFENKIEIIGGLTLIGIGIKIWIEHVVLNIA